MSPFFSRRNGKKTATPVLQKSRVSLRLKNVLGLFRAMCEMRERERESVMQSAPAPRLTCDVEADL
uniref:Uncharacterized protein n=1 Tax=Anguilla anguilla TaxID=7936 RepID=A0A0E9WC31_ANGAN